MTTLKTAVYSVCSRQAYNKLVFNFCLHDVKKRQIDYLKVDTKPCCQEHFGWAVVVFKKN